MARVSVRLWALLAALLTCLAQGDVYLHNPRGSNNKLSEQSNNVNNNRRLFDSQNNNAGGYQIGDRCRPVCQSENRDYDENKEGAMMGQLTFYAGSELYIEWALQHSCGHENSNVICQVILQYMCDSDNPALRDGVQRGNDNTAGGQQEPPVAAESEAKNGNGEYLLGQHEPLDFYLHCRKRERNKGLYTADRQMNNDRGATATRQNPGGNANAGQRNGLECPEERDYYPYWHPSPWHDIAVITDEPEERCAYYQAESQNVKAKNYCSEQQFNNEADCKGGGGTWEEQASFGEDAPKCITGVRQRDNHNGNSEGAHPQYFMWKIPDGLEGRCVLRLRYNMTSGDFRAASTASGGAGSGEGQRRLDGGLLRRGADPRWLSQDAPRSSVLPERDTGNDYFLVDASQNDPDPGRRRRSTFTGGPPVLIQDPIADFVNLGSDYMLQMNLNTNQYGRTFQDRTHSFYVKNRPFDVPGSARIVNYNVRGRRGNIVQVYPAVEYDFVPTDLSVEEGDFLHFQWAGSDANAKGNEGNGRQGTDRSNLVQMDTREQNIPMAKEGHTLFYNAATDPDNEEGLAIVRKMAYLDQNDIVTCDQNPDPNQDQATNDCQQLNGASAYFDGGVIEMKQVGDHKVMSTRNNDFSNRSQKATIKVNRKAWKWWEIVLTAAASLLGAALVVYLGAAAYAFYHPQSWLFSPKYRPRVLKWVARPQTLQQMEAQHKEHKAKQWEQSLYASGRADVPDVAAAGSSPAVGSGNVRASAASTPIQGDSVRKPWAKDWGGQLLVGVGIAEGQRHGFAVYVALNLAVFAWGYFTVGSQLKTWGVQRSSAWAIAVGAGYALSLNLAVGIFPSLKSLHTALRGSSGALRDWIPIDDPFMFQTQLGIVTGIWTLLHAGSHASYMRRVAYGVPLQEDVLHVWRLTAAQESSGSSMLQQALTWQNFTGLLGLLFLIVMFVTVVPRYGYAEKIWPCLRLFGGFKLYQRAHALWPAFYMLILLHGTPRLYVWLLFPVICYFIDKSLLMQRQTYPAVMFSARLVSQDVLHLAFEVPEGFSYQAGQYILLWWRGEWHPFSLTSAPEEAVLSLHIRAPAQYDWCHALRQRVLAEAPIAAGTARQSVLPVPGTAVEYERMNMPSGVVSVPRGQGGKDDSERAAGRQAEEPMVLRKMQHKDIGDTVAMQIAGPFGAESSRIWEFDVVMLVGVGYGATPLASILRSVQMRAEQRAQILSRAGGGSKSSDAADLFAPPSSRLGYESSAASDAELRRRREAARSCAAAGLSNGITPVAPSAGGGPSVLGAPASGAKASRSGTANWSNDATVTDLIRRAIRVPCRIHVYWLVHSSEELHWFHSLLASAMDGPAKAIMDVNIFIKPEVDKSQLEPLPCRQQLHVGQPRWGSVFKACKVEHPGCNVGVFLCGSSEVGPKLLKQARKRSDPPDAGSMGTSFSYFKEHF